MTDGTSNTVAFSEIVQGLGTTASTFDSLKPSSSPTKLSAAISGRATVNGSAQTDYNNCNPTAPTAANVAGQEDCKVARVSRLDREKGTGTGRVQPEPVPFSLAKGTLQSSCVAGTGAGGYPFGATWWWGRSGQTRYNHVMPPNSWSCDFGADNADSDAIAITAGSRHSGGVNCAMLDGSVRFVKSTINTATWWAISTMSGSEVVSADQYEAARSLVLRFFSVDPGLSTKPRPQPPGLRRRRSPRTRSDRFSNAIPMTSYFAQGPRTFFPA